MEFADLLGVKEEQATHRAALDAVQSLLESLDARAQRRAAQAGAQGRLPVHAQGRAQSATRRAARKRSR